MLVRELIKNICADISLVDAGEAVDDSLSSRCLHLLNMSINQFNLQEFLHFTTSKKELGNFKEYVFESNAPLKIKALYYKVGSSYRQLSEVSNEVLTAYETSGCTPSVFSYERICNADGTIIGKLTLNVASQYPLTAIVINDFKEFGKNDVFTFPKEYENLVVADVQLRLLKNMDASESLIRHKVGELTEIKKYIKEHNFVRVDMPRMSAGKMDAILGGVGRFPW